MGKGKRIKGVGLEGVGAGPDNNKIETQIEHPSCKDVDGQPIRTDRVYERVNEPASGDDLVYFFVDRGSWVMRSSNGGLCPPEHFLFDGVRTDDLKPKILVKMKEMPCLLRQRDIHVLLSG